MRGRRRVIQRNVGDNIGWAAPGDDAEPEMKEAATEAAC
jgi:hypothetical protein